MKKRILSFLLVLVMAIGFLPTVAFATNNTYGALTYNVNDGEVKITDCKEDVTSVDIPSEIDGYPVTSIGNYAFESCSSLKSITIPNNVTSIGDYAFRDCTSFEKVYISSIEAWLKIDFSNYDSVPLWSGADLYLNNSLVTEVIVPESITKIKNYTFYRCKSLKSITIPNSVTSIGDYAFRDCTSLTSVSIPNSVTRIGEYSFDTCASLVSIKIPNSVTRIGKGAFGQCVSLTSIVIPNGVTSISGYSFYWCSKLTNITIPSSVTSIGDCAFYGCQRLTDVWYQGNEQQKTSITINGYSGDGDNSRLTNATWHYNTCEEDSHIYSYDCDTTCDACDYTRQTTHNYEWIVDKSNNCGVNGVKHEKCSVCHVKRNENTPIVATGNHAYTNNCDTSCNVCGATRTTTHSFGAYVYNNNATTSADGTKTRTCSVCGHSETVVAVGTKLPTPKPAPIEKPIYNTTEIFTDVAQDWYTQYVDYAYSYGIFKGNEDGTFKPLNNITRAEFVQVLANITGVDTSNKQLITKFVDAKPGDWFTPAVKWANENGIVAGKNATQFGPEENITREQMCVMIVNYAKFKGISLKVVEAKEAFVDDGLISSWAKDAVYACQMADIVNGKGEGRFDPAGTGLRAEACVIFTKFHQGYLQ